ncbi:uncharacterized protein LOC115435551 isoform X2 [Sphaeramia orbicularis]|uniref:uncharacterized protein LOC115435551 isoform X2 n=1 Tax=Sphaeramia orbicularis TaxID=375764 RepID=UPI00117CA340|nr:uncharacterized protein LOC115435551 isoform X2 [Sphaeramia orbicularis]
MISFLYLGLIFFTQVKAGLRSSDDLVMFASPGGSVTLPCAIKSIESCSSINWDRAEQGWISWYGPMTKVVRAGTVTAAKAHKYRLLNNCSLQINNMATDDARVYTCDNKKLNSTVALSILQLDNSTSTTEEITLQCYLNTFKGSPHCNFSQIQFRWSMEDNTPIHGRRFRVTNQSKCIDNLLITKKATDHFRNWKCHLIQNGSHKATASFTTKLPKDGIEEVFAAVGESVSFSCSNTSSSGLGGEGRPQSIFINEGSSSVITKVSTTHSGDYKCLDPTNEQHKHFRLHTFDVTSEYGPDGNNLTLTCVLTCANKTCEKDFNLTWSNRDPHSWQSGLMNKSGNLINKLFFPVLPIRSDETVCSVRREGAVVASKTWSSFNSLRSLAWLALPVGILVCITVGGIYVYMKRKHNKDADTCL